MQSVGYLAVAVAASTFVLVLLMVGVGAILGFVHSTKAVKIEDPMEGDPDVISGSLPPIGKGEMNPFEATSVKLSLPFVVSALVVMVVIIGFSAYGLREMAGSTGTAETMRQEAREREERNRERYGTEGPAGIEELPPEDEDRRTPGTMEDMTAP